MAREVLLEKLGQAFGVIALHVLQNGHFFGVQIIEREFRHDGPLERIDEADTENVIAFFRYRGIGRTRRHHWDFRFLANRRGFERARASDFSDDRNGLVARD